MYKYFIYYCEKCKDRFEDMKNDSCEDIEHSSCPVCSSVCNRMPFATIAKLEIAEKTHGGEVSHGRIINRFSGIKEMKEERQLEKTIRKAKRSKDMHAVKEATKELSSKRAQNKKELTK